MKNFVVSLLILAMAGCGVQYAGVSQGEHNTDLIDQLFGTVPVPPRPPVRLWNAALGVPAPGSNNLRTFEVMHDFLAFGEESTLITGIWVAGIKIPIARQVKIRDHVFTVSYLENGQSIYPRLPSCHQLDGSGHCRVRVTVQVESWRYDAMGLKVPDGNAYCAERTEDARGRIARMDWPHRMKDVITCPNDHPAVTAAK